MVFSGYTELKDLMVGIIYDDNKVIGKAFLYAEKKVGVERKFIAIGAAVFLLLYLAVGYGAQVLGNILGFLYPAYASMKAIESDDKNDDSKWLTYWVVFGFVNIIELPFEFILQYIPFFSLCKCLFFIWCFMPIFDGSTVVYKTLLRPYFLEVEKDVHSEVKDLTHQTLLLFEAFIKKETLGKLTPSVPSIPSIGGSEKKDK